MQSNEVAFDQIMQALSMMKKNNKENILEMETRFNILEAKNNLIKKALQDLAEKL